MIVMEYYKHHQENLLGVRNINELYLKVWKKLMKIFLIKLKN